MRFDERVETGMIDAFGVIFFTCSCKCYVMISYGRITQVSLVGFLFLYELGISTSWS